MLGKASEIKTRLLIEFFGRTIEDEIVDFLESHQNFSIIDIKFAIMTYGENEVYREALIIYKEGESS